MKKVREIRSRVASDFLLWQKPLSRLPLGGDAQASSNKTLTWKINKAINRPAPFPFGKGGGIGPNTPKIHHNRGKVRSRP